MDNYILPVQSDFDSVWARVTAQGTELARPAAEKRGSDLRTLEAMMDGEARDAEFYTRLSKQLATPGRAVVLAAAADEKRHMKKLQLEYYLLTGNSYTPHFSPQEINGALSALREAYLDEKEGAEGYLRAAAQTGLPELKAVYSELSADEARHAAAMRRLIASAIG